MSFSILFNIKQNNLNILSIKKMFDSKIRLNDLHSFLYEDFSKRSSNFTNLKIIRTVYFDAEFQEEVDMSDQEEIAENRKIIIHVEDTSSHDKSLDSIFNLLSNPDCNSNNTLIENNIFNSNLNADNITNISSSILLLSPRSDLNIFTQSDPPSELSQILKNLISLNASTKLIRQKAPN